MRRKLIDSYARFLGERRRWVILASLGLTGISAALLPRLEFRTARSALRTDDDPDVRRFDEFLAELGPNAVVVVAEGGTEAERRGFIEDLARRLEREKGSTVGEVFHRVPAEFLRARALGLRPAGELGAIAEGLAKELPALADLGQARGLADLHRIVRERIERELKAGRRPESEDPRGLAALRDLLAAEMRLIEKPAETAAALEGLDLFALAVLLRPDDPGLRQMARGGSLASFDGSFYVAVVRPRGTSDALPYLRDFVGRIRGAAEEARLTRPAVGYGLTGIPITILEESDSVGRDAPLCSLLAATGIGLLAMVAFRRKLAALLVLASLGMGIIWNFGITWAVFGGVNLITSSVPVILLALGIDFGIHVVIAYEAERAMGRSPEEAIAEALARIGPGLTTGAFTTALAFFSICFMEYRGFREFGVIAGSGVLVCLLAMVSALPALLVATDRRPERPPPAPFAALVEELVEEAPDLPPPTSRLRQAWRKVCRGTTRFPVLTTAAALGLSAWFFHHARGIEFDYRVENLLPRDAESLRTQERLESDPRLSPEFAAVFCADRKALEEADARAAVEKVIARRHSILDVLAGEPPAARAGPLKRLQALIEPLALDPARLAPVDRAALRASIEELGAVFERALDGAATAGGLKETSRLLDQIVSLLESAAKAVGAAPAGWEMGLEAALYRVWSWARARKEEISGGLAQGPVREEDLPREILGKLKGARSGRYVLYLHPAENLKDRAAVKRFVEAARRVHPEATGYPIVYFASTSLIHRGFSTAVAAAAVVIFITLFLDFRRISLVLLATLPKGLGIIWMLGIMRHLGLNYNLANQIVIPLLIGVGLAFGIHLIHRFFMARPGERDLTDVLEHTGGAIVLSGLTTMIGFGSLALASHRGLASMGTVLFFGVGAALVTSTVVLANVLRLVYRPKR